MPVLMEKDEEAAFIERFGLTLFPAYVWTDGTGKELSRAAQLNDSDELREELLFAVDELKEAAAK